METKNAWFYVVIFTLSFIIRNGSASSDECVYTVYVRTGSILKAGTDSKISLSLYDQHGLGLDIKNLKTWGGLKGPDWSYFERGNLDVFSGLGPCITESICSMKVTSDGSGSHHGWYCNYIEVTITGPHIPCTQKLFTVEQWLARDAAPYELSAIRDYCPYTGAVVSDNMFNMPDRTGPLKMGGFKY